MSDESYNYSMTRTEHTLIERWQPSVGPTIVRVTEVDAQGNLAGIATVFTMPLPHAETIDDPTVSPGRGTIGPMTDTDHDPPVHIDPARDATPQGESIRVATSTPRNGAYLIQFLTTPLTAVHDIDVHRQTTCARSRHQAKREAKGWAMELGYRVLKWEVQQVGELEVDVLKGRIDRKTLAAFVPNRTAG